VEYRLNAQTGRFERWAIQEQEHGDLLLVRHGTRQLIDVTVVRPTTLTLLQRGAAATGSHMKPLVAADDAERLKLAKYTAECQRAGWTMVPFALESYGAKGKSATRLLQRMAAHSLDRSPEAFLAHADRVLSVALQVGNAGIAGQGTAELHLQTYRRGRLTDEMATGGTRSATRSAHKQTRNAAHASAPAIRGGQLELGAVLHGDYHSARVGARAHTAGA
jgi:hypothetical protein